MSMLDEYGFEIYEESEFPLAYLLTFRTYGTWLHGDERHSVDRHGRNAYGTPDISPNKIFHGTMKSELKQPVIILNALQRVAAEAAVRELCERRKYHLRAINARSNHVHSVVSVRAKPERLVDAFKAAATKRLREEKLFPKELQIWSRGRSRLYVWKPRHVVKAVEYVLYGQGDVPFEIED